MKRYPYGTDLWRVAVVAELARLPMDFPGEAIARFSGVLESQDPNRVSDERAALLALIDRVL